MSFIKAQGMGHDTTGATVGIFCRHSAQAALVIRVRVPRDQFARGVRDALQRLKRCAARQPEPMRDPPFIAYHTITAASVEIEVGVPVAENLTETLGAERANIPAGRYVSVSAQLGDDAASRVCRELEAWFVHNSEHCAGPIYITLVAGSGSSSGSFLVQRKIVAGPEIEGESGAGRSLLNPETSALAQIGLEALAQERQAAESSPGGLQRVWEALRAFRGDIRVGDVMSRSVISCEPSDSLATAAQHMWEHDTGALPVLGENAEPIAMITDRDICMAAYTQGKRLSELPVACAMSHALYVCRAEDALLVAEQEMAERQVRRLAVVDARGALAGIISMNDIALARAQNPLRNWITRAAADDVTTTLATISRHRTQPKLEN